jgi:poly-gamma-glutamate synthase PgsB/CapB
MLVVLILLLVFIGYSLVEYVLHRRNLGHIPIRVQVNGTRGKSSVTRLIAAGLRAGGKRVAAKTTGTRASFILGDDEERPVLRLGKPNVGEQVRMVRTARQMKAEALVFENMSLLPQYQIVENRILVRPTHAVVTNVRADHLDVMGPRVSDVALTFGRALPRNSVLFTAERRYLDSLTKSGRHEALVADPGTVRDEDMHGFNHVEHKENVALALDVCERLGVDRTVALAGMKRSRPDPGALRVLLLRHEGREVEFVNALAANDPDSIGMIWQLVKDRDRQRIVLVNCRTDRQDRSRQMAELVSGFGAERYVATGGTTRVFLRRAAELGIPKDRLKDLGENLGPAVVYKGLFGLVRTEALVFACGNTVGYGEELVGYFVRAGGANGH